MIVIDASIALKWFIEEERRERALNVLELIRVAPSDYAVPDLFYLEMTSVLARLMKSRKDLHQTIADLYDLGLTQVRLGAGLLKTAADIAFEYRLSGYDALYAACAQTLGGQWLTADKRAHAKISRLSISKLL